MGRYLNPKSCTKEEWLAAHIERDEKGEVVQPTNTHKKEGYTAAVLVANPGFTACALATTQEEMDIFNDPRDQRQKVWVWIPDILTDMFQ